MTAGGTPGAKAQCALEELLAAYDYPLYSHLRRQGLPADRAREMLQGFFVRLIECAVVSAADPAKGRFRSFLLTSLKNYVANQRDHESVQRRGGNVVHVSIPARWSDLEGRYGAEPATPLTPERQFEQAWARQVVAMGVRRAREGYAERGEAKVYDALIGRLRDEDDDLTYAQIGKSLGMNAGALRVAMFRLRRHLAAATRSVVADTVHDPKDVDAEIRYFFKVLEDPRPGS